MDNEGKYTVWTKSVGMILFDNFEINVVKFIIIGYFGGKVVALRFVKSER